MKIAGGEISEQELRWHRYSFIPGLGGKLFVRDGMRKWVCLPVNGRPGVFRQASIDAYARHASRSELGTGLRRPWNRKTRAPSPGLKPIEESHFTLNISRQRLGEIYVGLMNEISVMKYSTRFDPFSIQRWRQRQAQTIAQTDLPLWGIHTGMVSRIPQEDEPDHAIRQLKMGFVKRALHGFGKRFAPAKQTGNVTLIDRVSMSNDVGAEIQVGERDGKPFIIVQEHGNCPTPDQKIDIAHTSNIVEMLLRQAGVSYEKTVKA